MSEYTRITIFLNYFATLRNPVPSSYCGCKQAFLICQLVDEETYLCLRALLVAIR